MSKKNIRFRDWMTKQKEDPEFSDALKDLEPGHQVARLRILRGLTQAELAERVGTQQPSIARLESGKIAPRVSFLEKVVDALSGDLEIRVVRRELAEPRTEIQKIVDRAVEYSTKAAEVESHAIYVRLSEAGVRSRQDLLEKAASARDRKKLARMIGISSKLILDQVKRLDLRRVKGVGGEYAGLLKEAGIDTVPELARRNPGRLHRKLIQTNRANNLVLRVPGRSEVTEWVKRAKELPRVIKY
jgi:transcriptional regulator with XRE-family HTH domain